MYNHDLIFNECASAVFNKPTKGLLTISAIVMRRTLYSIVSATAILAFPVQSLPQNPQPRILSVCDLLKDRLLYRNKTVTVRGAWVIDFENSRMIPHEANCIIQVGSREEPAMLAVARSPKAPARPSAKVVTKTNGKPSVPGRQVLIVTLTGKFETKIFPEGPATPDQYMGYGLYGEYIGLLTYEQLADPLWIPLSNLPDLQKK